MGHWIVLLLCRLESQRFQRSCRRIMAERCGGSFCWAYWPGC
uniref:Uncharacterized protein n=1 Tax=Anguilla anguilla TaxID=7936 RepID=A0A0E9VZQ4_ANGAN